MVSSFVMVSIKRRAFGKKYNYINESVCEGPEFFSSQKK